MKTIFKNWISIYHYHYVPTFICKQSQHLCQTLFLDKLKILLMKGTEQPLSTRYTKRKTDPKKYNKTANICSSAHRQKRQTQKMIIVSKTHARQFVVEICFPKYSFLIWFSAQFVAEIFFAKYSFLLNSCYIIYLACKW